jgi:adenylylsulfate kinase-like enzyme
MIIVLFGQPHSGKSTLAEELIQSEIFDYAVNIDGDRLRDLFANKDFSREGRIKNLNRASDTAVFLDSIGTNAILSLVYPYQEARDYLNGLSKDVHWVYLTYTEERGREKNHVKDFEIPEKGSMLELDTTDSAVKECIQSIQTYVKYNRFKKP